MNRLVVSGMLVLSLLGVVSLMSCGGNSEKQQTQAGSHDGHDHGAHAGHDHSAHETQGGHYEGDGHDHSTHAESADLVPQSTCPVMGGSINKELYVDKNGKRIYMCCEACREKLETDFEKYEAKLKEMGQKPEKI